VVIRFASRQVTYENDSQLRSQSEVYETRSGVVASDTVPQPIIFSAPPEFQGEPRVWTPEHFFVAAVVSCYMSTFFSIADA
jgi:organic hydroperoxide reductase OsmC/OhrA